MRSHSAGSPLVAALAAFVVALPACAPQDRTDTNDTLTQSSAGGAVADIRVSEVQIGKTMGSDMKIATPVTTFTTRDTLHVSIATTGTMQDASVLVMMKPAGGDTAVVVQESKTISPTGPTVTAFHIAKPDVLKPGKYVVQVFLNGALQDIKNVEITG